MARCNSHGYQLKISWALNKNLHPPTPETDLGSGDCQCHLLFTALSGAMPSNPRPRQPRIWQNGLSDPGWWESNLHRLTVDVVFKVDPVHCGYEMRRKT